jgi:Phospholipase_D-nuclease N-terminal
MPFEGGFTFTNFVADAFAVFMLILWFWLLITISGDLFRRHDVSGFGKVLWVILLIVLPYVGIFAYIFTQGRGTAERNEVRAKEAQDGLRQSAGFASGPASRVRRASVRFNAGRSTSSWAAGRSTTPPCSSPWT